MSRTRLAKLSAALAQDDAFEALSKVRELLPDDGEGAQQTVVYGYAAVLEVNSSGLSVLFDRLDDEELWKCRAALDAIGAEHTLHAFDTLHPAFVKMIAAGTDRFEAAERLAAQPATRRLDREHQNHVGEMEQKLLAFCRTHVAELAAG